MRRRRASRPARRSTGRGGSSSVHLAHEDLVVRAGLRGTLELERVPARVVPVRDHFVALDVGDAVAIVIGPHDPDGDLAELVAADFTLEPVRVEAGLQRLLVEAL